VAVVAPPMRVVTTRSMERADDRRTGTLAGTRTVKAARRAG
jgi:hypothetical protein